MTMTKKDYIAIADCILSARNECCKTAPLALNMVVSYLVDKLAADNPRFDRARFLTACGVQS